MYTVSVLGQRVYANGDKTEWLMQSIMLSNSCWAWAVKTGFEPK